MIKVKKIELCITHHLYINNIFKYTRAKDNYLDSNGIIPNENVFVTKFAKKYNYRLAEKEIYKIGKAVNLRDSIRTSPHTLLRSYFLYQIDVTFI